MKKSTPQILPQFNEVKIINSDIISDCYSLIYDLEQKNKHAYLIDEDNSLSNFINKLGEADEESENNPLNLYDFYAAYNIKFPTVPTTVMLINQRRIISLNVCNFADLLNAVIKASRREQHAIFINKSELTPKEAYILKRDILQQFIYLRMYLPIIVADNAKTALKIFNDFLHQDEINLPLKNISLFGTKKAGKSSLINAVLNDNYAPSSSELPTPNKIIYSPCSRYEKIRLHYEGAVKYFYNTDRLSEYLMQEFQNANKQALALNMMEIFIPNFPKSLKNYRLVDTPGPNFSAAEKHKLATKEALNETDFPVFVMNYSSHLTTDEIDLFSEVYETLNIEESPMPLIVAVNRIDEMYSAEVVKSYERIADYIKWRLNELGYENILVISTSAILAVYLEKVRKLLFEEYGELDERIGKINKKYRGTENSTMINFVEKTLEEREDFHGMKITSIYDLKLMSRVPYLKHIIKFLFNYESLKL